MKNFIDRLLRNPVTFEITSVFVYAFYCLVFAAGSIPSVLFIRWGMRFLDGGFALLLLFIFICSLAFYIFLVCAALVVGFTERLLTLGLKPGAYQVGSPEFFRWLVYSGLHLWAVNIVLPFLRGNNWIKIYLRVAGAKVGKGVFVNSHNIYDAYLLEIGNDVIVGGEVFLNCHLYENDSLILGKIIIGDGTTVGGGAYLTPGTTTGVNSKIGMYTYLRRNTDIADGESILTPPGMTLRQVIKLMRTEKSRKIEKRGKQERE
jgi:acetyltransferase-like isoleucine patch superfamily enzyme